MTKVKTCDDCVNLDTSEWYSCLKLNASLDNGDYYCSHRKRRYDYKLIASVCPWFDSITINKKCV